MGVFNSVFEGSSEHGVYSTKLDRIEETINRLGESNFKDGVIEKLKKNTFKNRCKLKKENVIDTLHQFERAHVKCLLNLRELALTQPHRCFLELFLRSMLPVFSQSQLGTQQQK